MPFAALALGGAAPVVVGAVKDNSRFSNSGAVDAVLFTSVAVGIALSARNPRFEAMTLSLTAVERYNDE